MSWQFYKADPHQWGEGKTHLLQEDGLKTFCGKAIANIPGQTAPAEGGYDCGGCWNAFAARERRLQQEREWQERRLEREREEQLLRQQQQARPAPQPIRTGRLSKDMEMPFGKHRGEFVSELPDGYLEWLAREVNLYGRLRAAVREALEMRGMPTDELDENQER